MTKTTFLLFLGSILIFLYTLFVNIEGFPIYFMCDEAIQAVKAETLIKNGFKDEYGKFFPFFFQRFGDLYNLGITVYLHVPSVFFLGKKIWLVRGTTVIISLMGSIFTALILKEIFKLKNFWVAMLYLVSIPLFFLHARTGFEPAIATSFYAGFLYFYLLYRTKNPLFLLLSIIFAALAFYSYSGIYVVVASTGLLFAVIDLFFHLKNIKFAIIGLLLTIMVFTPLFTFLRSHVGIAKKQFEIYGIFLIKNEPFKEKAEKLFANYSLALNPNFLFVYHPSYHPRHYLKGYGYFPFWSIPIILLGLLYVFVNIKKPVERTVLLAFLASPLGGVIMNDAPGATRIFPMVITLTCLFGLGIKVLEMMLEKVSKRKYLHLCFSVFLFSFFFSNNLFFTYNALTYGPLWFNDYTLYGMQYGAKQLFGEINNSLNKYQNVIVSTDFANAIDIFFPFFLSPEKQARARLIGPDQYYNLSSFSNTVFFLDEGNYKNLLSKTGLYNKIKIVSIIPTPNNKPQFYKLEIYKEKEI